MNEAAPNLKVARECIQKSIKLIAAGKNETVIRDSFTSYLRSIFPSRPSWVEHHIQSAETALAVTKKGNQTTGFVDNLVDLTVIEYESDLTSQPRFDEGFLQVKGYCASLINKGNNKDLVLGVLSDTVRWFVYSIEVNVPPGTLPLTGDQIKLNVLDSLDLSKANGQAALRFVSFLSRYLGRIGVRPLSAESISGDLGFDSQFGKHHRNELGDLVSEACVANPKYADLIKGLWCSFVTYFRDRGTKHSFNQASYADELYILTLGKLICANVIEKRALVSDNGELASILDGKFFVAKGLVNLVEFDYFGWLNKAPYVAKLLPVARALQKDLQAYDFNQAPAEDVFGRMMAQLAQRSQRILLGQEWTPSWLARQLVERVMSALPAKSAPQLVDMCCGSGAMVVETVKQVERNLSSTGKSQEAKLKAITQAITGFDIDPLAVILSKINWVLAAHKVLEPFGNVKVTIPIYHADSLFAITPLSNAVEEEKSQDFYNLKVAEYSIKLPKFLVSPRFQSLFDEIIERAYGMASVSNVSSSLRLSDAVVADVVADSEKEAGAVVSTEQRKVVTAFIRDLTEKITLLNLDGRNGVWIFILRNSYRPGLVAGQFNGLVSNPPWLALSKIAQNPYQDVLRKKAEDFRIKPTGSSHLHIELATIFLLHAIARYLRDDAFVGCITPETVLNGHHHNPFRIGAYAAAADTGVKFQVEEIWRVQEGTFKNRAIVLFGHKTDYSSTKPNPIPGMLATPSGQRALKFRRHVHGKRTIWSDQIAAGNAAGLFSPANFRQGADIMPRTFFLYEPHPAGLEKWRIESIHPVTSQIAFAVKDAKRNQSFKITPSIVPNDLLFDVATSNLLTPFELGLPLKALLPIKKDAHDNWGFLPSIEIAAKGAAVQNVFQEIIKEAKVKDVGGLAKLLNVRNKLTQQLLSDQEFLIVTGAGGGRVCCAYVPKGRYSAEKLVIDQTLYWTQVKTEDEAIYLVAALNSEAVSEVIHEFQPKGEFGERHVHKLPFGVTPPYDPQQASHQAVVEQTRKLLADYAQAKSTDIQIRNLLNPNEGSLAQRRRAIQAKLARLPSYPDYTTACRDLYGL
jgi:hypothetical protein